MKETKKKFKFESACTENAHFEYIENLKEKMEKEKEEREDALVEEIEMIRGAVANLEAANLEKEKLWEERGRKMLQLYERR